VCDLFLEPYFEVKNGVTTGPIDFPSVFCCISSLTAIQSIHGWMLSSAFLGHVILEGHDGGMVVAFLTFLSAAAAEELVEAQVRNLHTKWVDINIFVSSLLGCQCN
jgi:hypothetical protein